MLDIRRIRNNPQEIIDILATRGTDYSAEINEVLKVDEERRVLSGKRDGLKNDQSKEQKAIPQLMKEGKKDEAEQLKADLRKLADEI